VALIVHCTLIETTDMHDAFGRRPKPLPFRDLLPWADPYISGLIDRLRRHSERPWARPNPDDKPPQCEADPRLDELGPDYDDLYFGDNWPLRTFDDDE
jgi:hypothetical protein